MFDIQLAFNPHYRYSLLSDWYIGLARTDIGAEFIFIVVNLTISI